ncbi:transporter substrate-binding domain-containing protein [Simiduia sp. 21SJ11W-1]|uniref:transporter substrate-binding domain-containing protein n=1 Tax=Simiduia sp. 21SJ11W-1 TaxID=2909669 RepID=UPI00209FC0F0|nr:transporter substrate-binding domain-containing protein [Simiduia sp. 21SJ11W-1]UTA47699.1 transporter substrate-binding domain-containing protein [Simiduia sp. 21SJ11W-1]
MNTSWPTILPTNNLRWPQALVFTMGCLILLWAMAASAEDVRKNLLFTIDSFYAQPIYEQHPARDRMRVALANLGYTYSLRYIKGPRTLTVANNGEADGEFARNRDYTDEFPNLVFVPAPVNAVHTLVVTRAELTDASRAWRDLMPRNRVVIPGSRVGRTVPEQFAALPTITADNYEQALKLVASGRADMVIIPANFDFLPSHHGGSQAQLVALQPQLEEEAAYMHLHKRHQHLVAPLASELEKLKYQTHFPD